ncbi:hypothetical protein JHK82_043662 [Glycine max]|nr:hypothetical protein JHK85_044210 [Glycine max]KAG5106692.1 hypothetical protein JHK82_043662 [Glycine max]
MGEKCMFYAVGHICSLQDLFEENFARLGELAHLKLAWASSGDDAEEATVRSGASGGAVHGHHFQSPLHCFPLSLSIRLLFAATNPNKVEIRYDESNFTVIYHGIPLGKATILDFFQQPYSTRQIITILIFPPQICAFFRGWPRLQFGQSSEGCNRSVSRCCRSRRGWRH